MKLLTVDFAIDLLEFVDRTGMIRTIHGCSLIGVEEFRARLEALTQLLEKATGEATIAKLYKQDKIFRHHCDRCLELNGVNPDWLDSKGLILESLLFAHDEAAGLLIRLNSADQVEGATQKGQSATPYDVGAALLGLSNDLSKVLEQLDTLPAKQVGKILEARAKQVAEADPESKKQADRKNWAAEMRSKGKGRAIAIPNSKPAAPV